MKKILLIFAALLCNEVVPQTFSPKDSRFTTALTSGYIIASRFGDIFHTVNAITADACYNFVGPLGVGAKASYWFTPLFHGKKCVAIAHEIPITAYLRTTGNFQNGLRLYGSFGGGIDIVGNSGFVGLIGIIAEAEVGLNYSIHNRVNFTSACRYIFPHNALDFRLGVAFEI